MKTTIKKISTVMAILALTLTAKAQKAYTLDPKSSFSVAGTSTLHDWTMKSASGTGTAKLTVADNKLTDITNIDITLPAESLKSEKKNMDKVAYEALKTKANKNIRYVLKSAEKVNDNTWNLTGTYTIAGASKVVKTQIKTSVANGVVNIQGTDKLTFKEYGMKSPTAMLGTIKTGENLTVKFNINFK